MICVMALDCPDVPKKATELNGDFALMYDVQFAE